MPFQVISPMLMNLDGSDFTEAVKNFVKLNRHLNINELILTDQIDYMRANIHYYNNGGRNKASIRMRPTTSRVIRSIPGTSMSFVDPTLNRVSAVTNTLNSGIFGPVMSYGPFGTPSAVIGPDNAVREIAPVVPVSASTGQPIRPMIGVPRSNIIGVGARGPLVAPGFGVPMYPGPVTFAPASTLIEWVDSTGKKFEDSEIIEKAYANIKDKTVTTRVTVDFTKVKDVMLEFTENKCKFTYIQPGPMPMSVTGELTRKGPSTPRIMVAASPRMIGPLPGI